MGNHSSTQTATAAELISLVHRFHPSHVYTTDARYASQAEAVRLRELKKAAQEESGAWRELVQRIQQELPECNLWELPSLLYDPCRCVRVSLPGSGMGSSEQKAVVLLVSILSPIHHLYASQQRIENNQVIEQSLWHPPLPDEYQAVENRLNVLAQSILGTYRLPNGVLFTPIPDIQVGNLDLGQAQIIHGLFTDRLW